LKQKELLNEKAAMLLADVNVINPPKKDEDKKDGEKPKGGATTPDGGEYRHYAPPEQNRR
ncbi:TPA: hypothetical protein ACIYM4_005834, partial [Escherichia coli]